MKNEFKASLRYPKQLKKDTKVNKVTESGPHSDPKKSLQSKNIATKNCHFSTNLLNSFTFTVYMKKCCLK